MKVEHYTNNNQNHFYFDLTPIQINKSQKEVVTVTKKQFYIAPIPKNITPNVLRFFAFKLNMSQEKIFKSRKAGLLRKARYYQASCNGELESQTCGLPSFLQI